MKLLSETTNSNNDNKGLQKQQNLSPSTENRIAEIRSKYPTIASFSVDFNPDLAEKYSAYPTRCIMGTSPTLTELKLSYEGSAHLQWLIAQLAAFQEKISVPNKMSKYELESCAQTIYDNFHHLKATEIMLFLARLLGGMYPVDWHGYVTPIKIVTALRECFMPWRNQLLYFHEQQERERMEREASKEPVITWEEYKKLKETNRQNPLTLL
jgi:hypothetical protein